MLLSFWSEKDVPANTVKTYDVHLYTFLTWTVDAGEWSASRPGRSNPWERALSTHWVRGWLGLAAGLNFCGKRRPLALTRVRTPDRPARIAVTIPAALYDVIVAYRVVMHLLRFRNSASKRSLGREPYTVFVGAVLNRPALTLEPTCCSVHTRRLDCKVLFVPV